MGKRGFMEFRKIDDQKFQRLLFEEDLNENNISIDDFFKNDTEKKKRTDIQCYVNNTITYKDGESISFNGEYYKIGNSTKYAYNLESLLSGYSNFSFIFHIISPYLRFLDAGKTEIDISSFVNELIDKLNKAIARENRAFSSENKNRWKVFNPST